MAISAEYNVYAGGRYVGTFSLAELRSQVSCGAIPCTATCGALRRVLFFVRQDFPVPLGSLPGFEQLASQGAAELKSSSAAGALVQQQPIASASGGRQRSNGSRTLRSVAWLLIGTGIALILAGFGSLGGSPSVFGAWMRQQLSLSVYTSDTFLFCVPGLIFAGIGFLILRSTRGYTAKDKNLANGQRAVP